MSGDPLNIPPQIEADKRLLKYKNYEHYLDSLLSDIDECYLGNQEICRTIAELGYRCAGETLTKADFHKRVNAVLNYHLPGFEYMILASYGMKSGNNLQKELAIREKSNRVGTLSTIIYLRPIGSALAGYIDYADRLNSDTNWKKFFHGDLVLFPKKTDLGYYNWKNGEILTNNSANYISTYSYVHKGLLFRNRFDRQFLDPQPNALLKNFFRKELRCKVYGRVVLFDHYLRQRI